MRLNFPAVLALATAGIVFAAAAEAGTETRAVSDFEAIATNGAIDLVVRQGSKEGLTISADDKLLPLIETVVEPGSAGRTLHVRMKRGERSYNSGQITVTVDVVKLTAVTTSGAGDIVVDGLKTPSFKLTISGSSDARLKALATESLEVRISGSGDVLVGGSAKQVKLSIAGSGDANLSELQADDVQVRIAGSGDANVTANKSLDVSVAGSGDVRYGGSATAVKTSMAGSGTLSRR